MLKIGIFGVGHLGKIHLSQLVTMKDVEVVGFYDPSNANAAGVNEQYNIPRFTMAEELIQQVDAIDIVSPTTTHFNLCELALRNGKHIFVEKPMTNTMEEAKTLVKLVEEANIKFQVGHVERFNPAFLALKGYDLKPMFIEVHRLAEFNPRGTDVSVILDLMIHDIDIVLSIVKSSISRISASGVAVMSDTPDIANVRIEFHNGCVANLTSSRISLKKMRKMRLFQKDAYIGIDFLDKKTEIIKLKTPQDEGLFTLDIDTNSGKKTIAIDNPEIKQVNAIRMELELFRDSILQNKPVHVNVIDGFQALEVAHQILQKIGKGQASPAAGK
ncbi:Gfo/Idh/MocA family oxidoreductase [Chitinophaga pendula]|uniref:Gfo/Idh/MocA family protein n=1 Tax=Chitinophaga TaxID=79328 RepID=UPI000BAF44EC|nr:MULTISPECIES: Gfo/Idh/MocA family oxidoreductase [Chitinophaga]ASZ11165.1 oxidoreductase [Chitinophaga sp. MD30]UCJ05839.1 Gfo/Idh/MocA family oxidoreductase [Chitinophaga pendula]